MSAAPSEVPIRLVCPACRAASGGARAVVALEPAEGGVQCPGCGTAYPRVEGVQCVPPDVATFREAQAACLAPDWLADSEAACAAAAELDPASCDFREAILPGQYALAHFPDSLPDVLMARTLRTNAHVLAKLGEWLDGAAVPAVRGVRCALDAGCGPGRATLTLAGRLADGAVGFDVRLSMLRLARRLATAGEATVAFRVEGRRIAPVRLRAPASPRGPVAWVQGDLAVPPFEAECFSVVVALSLLDSVPDPLVALGQLDALLAPGGLLVVGTPYHWEPAAVDPAAWWDDGAAVLRAALAGRCPALPHLAYDVTDEADGMPWTLPGHARVAHCYLLHMVAARKGAPSCRH